MINKRQDVKMQINFFKFDIASGVTEDSKYIELLKILLRKHNDIKTLVLDKEYKFLTERGIVKGVQYSHNLVPTTGFNVLTRLLTGDATYSGEVNYGALGDAVSPSFTIASTQLNNEVFRKLVSSASFDDNIAYIDLFIESGDVADDTYTEFGYFIDGTASADTGQAWSLLATGGWVKSGSIFISGQYTFANA